MIRHFKRLGIILLALWLAYIFARGLAHDLHCIRVYGIHLGHPLCAPWLEEEPP